MIPNFLDLITTTPVVKIVKQNKNEINPNDCKIKSETKLP